MIKKLRLKFILIAMFSVLAVLSAAIAAINISNYSQIEKDAKNTLQLVLSRGIQDNSLTPDPGNPPPPEQLRSEHYFVVQFDLNGNITGSDFIHIFTVTEEAGKALAASIFATDVTSGKYGNFRYQRGVKDATPYLAFVDVSEKLNSAEYFLKTSLIISSACYLVLLGIIVLSSKLVFKTSEESYQKQKSFVTNASHELKTPLTIISTDLELIEMDNGKSEWTESIHDQITRLTNMTNQMVTLSRLDEGNLKSFPFESFSISSTLQTSVDSFKPSFEKLGFKIKCDIEKDLECFGNKYLIDELFYIFLDNALKYTKSNGAIKIQLLKVNNKVQINFSNDIDDNEIDIKNLFERFYRSPNSSNPGSGIGLSIAKEIVKLHKGKINASTNEDKIIFSITF